MTLSGTRILLGLVSGFWALVAIPAAVLAPINLRESNAIPWSGLALAVPPALLAAVGFYAVRRIGPGRWLTWACGLLVHGSALAVLVAATIGAIAGSRLTTAGVVVGGLALVPLAGIVALLRAIPVLRQPSYPSSALAEERR